MITPDDVKSYTSFRAVQERQNSQLEMDIVQAEADIFQFVGHEYTDREKYPLDAQGNVTLPLRTKLAFIKLAEYYALVNSDESIAKGVKSESIGDYSYTMKDGESGTLSLKSLLSQDVSSSTGKSGTRFRMVGI